ncbi:MAG: HAMP domain-containing sensor histidine kinase [Halieaceae bacterium]|nr:HAMP domain-containing sensor histidine kinase [Halieaceae bacterium]
MNSSLIIAWVLTLRVHLLSRFSLALAAVGGLLFIVLTFFSYSNLYTQLNSDIHGRIQFLSEVYHNHGLERLTDIVARQGYSDDSADVLYFLEFKFADTSALAPAVVYRETATGPIQFLWQGLGSNTDNDHKMLAETKALNPGLMLTVGRFYQKEFDAINYLIGNVALVIAVFWLGAMVTTSVATHRALMGTHRISKELRAIMRQNLERRLQPETVTPYLKDLVDVGNEMLEHVALSLQGVRSVSDNIAHDLRTPLTRLRNKLTQLKPQVPREYESTIDELLSDCDDLLGSFNALLRISMLEAGSQIRGDAKKVSLRVVLQDVVDMYEPVAHDAGVLLDFQAEYVDQINGETDLLGQMFANIIDNAIKFTASGGLIQIRLERFGPEQLSVSIADSGIGIPQAERKQVFRRFYRGEPSRSEHKGHGLGLSLVQAIAFYHRANVELKDNNPGLRVEVYFPLAI